MEKHKREKVFALPAAVIRPLACGHGACFATDRITVDGERVGYALRAPPGAPPDSGWQFFAGDEDDAYLEDTDHLAIYDCNTIANYDPEIIPLLDAPVGSAFVRDPDSGRFVPDPLGAPTERD